MSHGPTNPYKARTNLYSELACLELLKELFEKKYNVEKNDLSMHKNFVTEEKKAYDVED